MAEAPLAVILAGGAGESLRQGAEYVPKLLLPVKGRPLLEHHIEWLRSAGIDTVALCLGVRADLVRERFGDGSQLGVKLRYQVEQTPLGSAGAVKALGLASLPEDIVVLPGEIYAETDLRRMLEFHAAGEGLATIAVREASPFAWEWLVAMGPGKRIVDFPPSPAEGQKPLSASSLMILRRPILRFVPDDRASDLRRDVLPAALREGLPLLGYLEPGFMAGLASPENYARLAKRLDKPSRPRPAKKAARA